MRLDRIFVFLAVALVLSGLVLAFRVIGTPSHARFVAIDERRVRDLQWIAGGLHERYGAGATLPARLPEAVQKSDPATRVPYEFTRLSASEYRLCATFASRSDPEENSGYDAAPPYRLNWRHGAGRTCYKLDVKNGAVDPEKF
jgi:hypothetical protein